MKFLRSRAVEQSSLSFADPDFPLRGQASSTLQILAVADRDTELNTYPPGATHIKNAVLGHIPTAFVLYQVATIKCLVPFS